jgi:transcriptional regulator with XRE-family HTH domain
MDERLHGRAGTIWQAYVGGLTQDAIAVEHGISQQRVSQILAEVRESIPDTDRADAALLAVERASALLAGVWPAAVGGDPKAVLAALRVMERTAKALGLDATEPLRVTLERRLDDEGQLVADALAAALDVLGLTEDQRIAALAAAQCRLLGQDPPAAAAPVPPVVQPDPGKARLEADFRKFAAENGFDPDEGDDDDDDV